MFPDCQSQKKKWKDKPITVHIPTLCDWFRSSASASDCDNLVFTRSEAKHKNQNAVFTRS